MTHHSKQRMTALVCILVLALSLLAGCGAKGGETITALEQLGEKGQKIGVGNDTPEYNTLQQDYPEAEIIAYSDNQLAYEDVARGRLDAYVYARGVMEYAVENGTTGVRLLDENYSKNTVAVGLSPHSAIPDLQSRINTFLSEQKADGILDDMYLRWVIQGDDTMPDIPAPEQPSLHLRVGTTGNIMPYSYYVGTELRGYDVELAYRFASWLGADVEFKIYDFGGILAAAASGDVDCIMSNLFYSPEKEEAIPFSDPLLDMEITAMVRDSAAAEADAVLTLDELNGKRFGVETGTISGEITHARLPDAKLQYFSTVADLTAALKAGRIDAFTADDAIIRHCAAEDASLAMVPELFEEIDFGFAFPKTGDGAALKDEFNAFLAGLKERGELEQLEALWTGADDDAKTVPPLQTLSAENGTLTLATMSAYPPFEYYKDGQIVGYEVDLAYRFCAANGYGLAIKDMNFDSILASVQIGKCDFACSGLTITPERMESVHFSEPVYQGGTAACVLMQQTAKSGGFLASIRDSFEKTFLRENRWQLFLRGVGTTMLITALSILFGTALGFAVFMLCRNGNPVANAVTRFCVWLVQGMPVVVLLMILYYVIFGSVNISGAAVSVVGFTLVFGSAVYAMLRSGVGTVDRGQTEAAYALGYTDRKAFFRVVLPQALPHFMPAYKGEITSLIKATAVVGYVAVQDLTKMGDIVRSRTYEAFSPLIAVAVIYFILAAILTFLVKKIEIRIDPKQRSREDILKGVKTDN